MPDHGRSIYTVALTGGIASGKTAVSDQFKALGVDIIDTDLIAHELVEPGQPLLNSIVELFGPDLLDDQGSLRRRLLRERIFADRALKEQLEALMHPAILAEARLRLRDAPGAYCMVVIPLLAEAGKGDWIDRVLVVDTDEHTQLERLMSRDGVTLHQAQNALSAQAGRAERLAIADDIIENSGALDDLETRVQSLHEEYKAKAKQATGR